MDKEKREFLSVSETAYALGASYSFTYAQVIKKKIPATKLGGRYFIPVEALENLKKDALGA